MLEDDLVGTVDCDDARETWRLGSRTEKRKRKPKLGAKEKDNARNIETCAGAGAMLGVGVGGLSDASELFGDGIRYVN